MKTEINYIPQIQLEKQFWSDNSYCTECNQFTEMHLDEGEVGVCLVCGEAKMVSVETAIEMGILESQI